LLPGINTRALQMLRHEGGYQRQAFGAWQLAVTETVRAAGARVGRL